MAEPKTLTPDQELKLPKIAPAAGAAEAHSDAAGVGAGGGGARAKRTLMDAHKARKK